MQSAAIDYGAILRDLTERRSELDAAIKAVRRIIELYPGQQALEMPQHDAPTC
jgi:hypothetical protein